MGRSARRTAKGLAWSEVAATSRKIVLNIGCGENIGQNLHPSFRTPDWQEIRIDIDPCVKPDFICSMTALTPVPSNSADAVWSSHNLEHVYRHEVPVALGEFLRVLKPGGTLLLTLPDLQQAAELVAADLLEGEAYRSPAGPITALDMIFGHTRSLASGNSHMGHRTGFTAKTLEALLIEVGFVAVHVDKSKFDLWASAEKRGA